MVVRSCDFCPAQITFKDNTVNMICPACGQINVLTHFENDADIVKRSEEEKTRAQEKLAETEAEKAQLESQLIGTLKDLDAISAEQVSGNERLTALLNAVRADQQKADGKQDVLHDLMTALSGQAEDHTGRLAKLGDLSGKILESQSDLKKKFGLMNEIMAEVKQLKLDEQKQYELIAAYTTWSTNIRKEDTERLKAIRTASEDLLAYRETLDASLADLRKESDEIKKSISSFHSEYTEDKQKKLTALYRAAEELQISKKYAAAEEKYREVVQNGGAEAGVYWRILLCHYGVEYVPDERRGCYLPTMYIPDLTPPAEMPEQKNLLESLDKASAEIRETYKKKLDELNAIIATYREVRFAETYDVFVSVKQNENGHITTDSDKGSELYDKLTGWGLKVFNSRRTKLRPGVEFEPQIFSALMSAKVMIVVGTKKAYMEAKWVQNEWRRFQWLRKNDKTRKRLLFCYLANGMKANEIPAALDPNLQAIVEGIDSESRLREAMKEAFPDNSILNPNSGKRPQAGPREAFERMLEPMLLKKNYGEIIKRTDEMVSFELLSANTVLYRVCAEKEIGSVNRLLQSVPELRNEPYIQNVSGFLEESEAKKLEDLLRKNEKIFARAKSRKIRKKILIVLSVLVLIAVLVVLGMGLCPKCFSFSLDGPRCGECGGVKLLKELYHR